MNATKTISRIDVEVGNIVHFYGARFEITEVRSYAEDDKYFLAMGRDKVVVATGKWIDGRIEPGYFGPGKDFTFQGNSGATLCVEA